MSRRVVNSGAFYTDIARSLGKPAGVAAAYVGAIAYTALACGLAAAFGYFTRLVLLDGGTDLPWYLYGAVAVVVVAVLGYRSVDLSAKILGTLMVLEFAVLIVFDVAAVSQRGAAAVPAVSFHPSVVFSGSIGIALMFTFVCFVGSTGVGLSRGGGCPRRGSRRPAPGCCAGGS